ncbi:MAG TPA: hypothetical protein VMU57_17415 [Edaphobacter sp.]|nr:hypothetical protein [Edaphobacter sp.]
MPVPSRSIQVGSAVRGRSFIDFSDPDRTNEHAIAFYECEIGRHHDF